MAQSNELYEAPRLNNKRGTVAVPLIGQFWTVTTNAELPVTV